MRGEIIFKHKMTPGKLSDKNQFLGIESGNLENTTNCKQERKLTSSCG